jgi:L-ascorbate metabolism protein UlaG (beta-lactamase superfamily)
MQVTSFGHSAFLVELAGGRLLFDPFIGDNPLSKDKVDITKIKTDAILVSHGHFDHVGDAAKIAKQNDCPVIAMVEVAKWLEKKQGVGKTIDLNFGGKKDLGFASVRMVPALHSSAMPDDSYGGNPAGFVVTHQDGTFYFSGDSALSMDMQLIAERYKPDTAFLCMGDTYTMDVEDALYAAQMLKVKRVIGMHYDTWPPIAIDHQSASDLFAKAGVALHLLPVLEKTHFNHHQKPKNTVFKPTSQLQERSFGLIDDTP